MDRGSPQGNYVANYIRPGPSSLSKQNIIALLDSADVTYYVSGNVVDGHPDWTRNNTLLFTGIRNPAPARFTTVDKAFDTPPVHTTTAEEALREVLEKVGATLPRRDPVDTRIVEEVEQRGGSIIDSQWEVGGWPEYHSARPPRDTDADGIPDDWEKRHGLNPEGSSDAVKMRDGSGYTNLEIYVNDVAEQAARNMARAR